MWAGGAITLLLAATELVSQASSQAIAEVKCEQIVKSGAEISRAQLSNLLGITVGSSREPALQTVAEPYCTLAIAPIATATTEGEPATTAPLASRAAYPLAFDPSAWVI